MNFSRINKFTAAEIASLVPTDQYEKRGVRKLGYKLAKLEKKLKEKLEKKYGELLVKEAIDDLQEHNFSRDDLHQLVAEKFLWENNLIPQGQKISEFSFLQLFYLGTGIDKSKKQSKLPSLGNAEQSTMDSSMDFCGKDQLKSMYFKHLANTLNSVKLGDLVKDARAMQMFIVDEETCHFLCGHLVRNELELLSSVTEITAEGPVTSLDLVETLLEDFSFRHATVRALLRSLVAVGGSLAAEKVIRKLNRQSSEVGHVLEEMYKGLREFQITQGKLTQEIFLALDSPDGAAVMDVCRIIADYCCL